MLLLQLPLGHNTSWLKLPYLLLYTTERMLLQLKNVHWHGAAQETRGQQQGVLLPFNAARLHCEPLVQLDRHPT